MGRWGGSRKEKERKRVSLWKAGKRSRGVWRNTEQQRQKNQEPRDGGGAGRSGCWRD